MIRIGTTSISARLVASSASFWSAVAIAAIPPTWARSGGRTLAATSRCAVGTTTLIASDCGRSKPATISAAVGRGRRLGSGAPVSQGDITCTLPSRRSAAARRGPCRSSAAAGPCSSTVTGTELPNWRSSIASARADWVPGTSREVGESRSTNPVPSAASTTTTSAHPPSMSQGWGAVRCGRVTAVPPPVPLAVLSYIRLSYTYVRIDPLGVR